MNLVFWAIASVGMTMIVVDGSIFRKVRELADKYLWSGVAEILHCHQCAGFWCGIIMSILLVSYQPHIWFACGCASSCLCVYSAYLLEYIEAKTVVVT